MTEEEWLGCEDPEPMFKFIGFKGRERKQRLYGCECCRAIWSEFTELEQSMIISAEQYADGIITIEELRQIYDEITLSSSKLSRSIVTQAAISLTFPYPCEDTFRPLTISVADTLSRVEVSKAEIHPGPAIYRKAVSKEKRKHATLVRDIFGNPFRPVILDPSWLTSTVTTLARQMYDTRDFSALPILADALQEAGCSDDQLLSHCRGEGVHVRGCFLIDACLGKE